MRIVLRNYRRKYLRREMTNPICYLTLAIFLILKDVILLAIVHRLGLVCMVLIRFLSTSIASPRVSTASLYFMSRTMLFRAGSAPMPSSVLTLLTAAALLKVATLSFEPSLMGSFCFGRLDYFRMCLHKNFYCW